MLQKIQLYFLYKKIVKERETYIMICKSDIAYFKNFLKNSNEEFERNELQKFRNELTEEKEKLDKLLEKKGKKSFDENNVKLKENTIEYLERKISDAEFKVNRIMDVKKKLMETNNLLLSHTDYYLFLKANGVKQLETFKNQLNKL